MIVEEDVASKINRLFDDYIQLEWELNSKVIDNVEALVEATYDIYSPAYNEAKKAVNAYALKYFNGDKRWIVDIIAEQFDNFDWFKPLTPSTIQHKLASYTNEVNDYVNNLWYYSRNYEEKVRQLMNEESKLLANKELTIKDLDNAKKNVKEKIIAYINKHTIKNWTMSMDKVNKVLDVVANNTMQADGKIYSVNFTSPEKWTDDISRFIYANAYDVANNITLPLPKDINVETIDNWALLKEWDKFADDLLQLQANELVKRLGEYDGPIYIFTDNYQLKKNRTLLVREPMHNIVFIDPSINNVNIKVEWSNMIVSSYNKNTFDSMVKQINSVVWLTTEWYKVDYAKINYWSLDITNRLKWLFKQYKIPQAQVKGLLDKNLNYLVNLVNGRKSVYDGTYSYNFVNVKDIKQQIDNRGIIQLASKDQLIEAVLWNEAELSYVIDDGFIHELNGDYWFELGDDYVINQQQKDMLYDWIVRSYISNNHAESAAAKLRILDMFMKNTPENVSLWKDIRTQLNHRVMTDKVELMNPIVRNTIKSLFYEDLMSSGLPASIQSYIMTISDVGDYILDNYKMIDWQIDDLLRESLNSKWAKMFYETKLPSEFSRFLENYFELNSKELVNYYYKSIGTPVDWIIEQEDIAWFSIQNMNNLTTTQKKGTALLFLYDNMRWIVNDIERVNDNMNYDLTRNLKDGYYLTDRKIFNYLNGISQFDIDNTIVKYNFDKVFQPKQKAALLKWTETFLDTVSEFIWSFFDNIKQARENKAQSWVEKFYKKWNIDNVYGELYIWLRNYSKFLQKYFGGTSQTNTIISSIKWKIFNVSRFSRYNDTTNKIFSKALEDIKEAIDEWQKKLLEEIANTWFETSYDRLFKSGETSKLTLWADVNGNEMLILDSYTLPKFIERESDYLWYGKIPSKELTTSEAQLYLGGMYVETFQKFLDDAVTGKYTDKWLESTFNYWRRLANPFYYKWPVNISDDLPYLKDWVGEFFTTESIPTFYTYELLSDHSNSMNILKSFFKDEIENGVINILDMSVKNMVTVLTEVYVRLDKATWISLEKFNNDMRKIIEYSMYRSIDEIFEPEVANNFRINIKDTLKEYAGDMINVLWPIHTTTNVKWESMLDTIKYITDTDKQFRHLVKNFWNYIDSLSKLSRDHEVVQSLMQWKYTINLMWENVNVADLVINKDQRMAFDKKIARIQERLDEARDNLIDDFGVEAAQQLREKFSFGDTEVKKQQKYTTTIEQVQEVTNKLWEYKSISDITNNMNYLLSDATYINKQNLIFKPNIYQKNYTELPDNFDRTEKYLSKKHYEPKDIDIDTTTRDKWIDEMRMQDSTMDDLLTDCL
jgi:hypothetical protein